MNANYDGKIRSVDLCLDENDVLVGKMTVLGTDGRFFSCTWNPAAVEDLLKTMGVKRLAELRGLKVKYTLTNDGTEISSLSHRGAEFFTAPNEQ